MKHEIIMASAGSGKTYRLSNRIISILLDGVDPRKVIALTFTRKAAGEFSSALFEKIAEAASDQEKADDVCADIGRPGQYSCAHFLDLLERVVTVLPEVYLGTLDSYFTRIIQAFQFELGLSTGSGVQILEGTDLEELKSEILNEILFSQETSTDFLQAFKQASFGKEEVAVSKKMDTFVDDWHKHFLSHGQESWGNARVATEGGMPTPWHKQDVEAFLGMLEQIFGEEAEGHAKISAGIDKVKGELMQFVGGSGRLKSLGTFFTNAMKIKEDLLSGVDTQMTFFKKIPLTGDQAQKLGVLLKALCEEELCVKVLQSKALWEVLKEYEAHYEERARQMGRLSFNDLKFLLGRWRNSEQDRITRELIDYRLDARHDHWLLDEFQDTSKDQYYGLKPLLDEVGMDTSGERSLFIVGDIKQSIYQWRGGDPKLFYKIAEDYGLEPEDMSQSWRSQEPVLSLVNHVCGNEQAMRACFGNEDALSRWKFTDHERACKPKPAYSEVRVFEEQEEKMEYLIELLKEAEPTKRGLSCALLIRDNKKVSAYAEQLREAGFAVAEEGKVCPTKDNPVGLMLLDLIKWIYNPSDLFAQRHLQMSPIGKYWRGLREDPIQTWKAWNISLYGKGLLNTIEELIAPLKPELSEFGADRLSYLLEEVRAFNGERDTLIRHLENLQVSVAESSNVIQVMTIHQSKGLGFDMVILPEISKDTVAHGGKFEVAKVESAEGKTIFSPPSKEVRSFFPPLSESEHVWRQEQYYEAFCVLYVALTRAKRGLYTFLPKKPTSMDNFTQWIYEALPQVATDEETLLFHEGEQDWFTSEDLLDEGAEKITPELPSLSVKRGRSFSAEKGMKRKAFTDSYALKRGENFHDMMEHLEWFPEIPSIIEQSDFYEKVLSLRETEEICSLLRRPEISEGQSVQLLREQPVEWIDAQGLWNTARLDRLHIILEKGKPQELQLIDYKTDDLASPEMLKDRHAAQLEHYRGALNAIYGAEVPVTCHLINLSHQYIVSWR